MHIKSILIALFTLVALGLSAQSHTESETFLFTKNTGLKFFERAYAMFDFDRSVVYMKNK